MNISDTIHLTSSYHGPVGSQGPKKYSLHYGDVGDLIANLAEQDVEIDLALSEKFVKYSLKDQHGYKERKVTVPLSTIFPDGATDLKYILRNNEKLELTISDYNNRTMGPAPGVIGGSTAGNHGIQCQLKYEAKEVDTTLVDRVKIGLEKTFRNPKYHDPTDELADKLRKIMDKRKGKAKE